jgi:large subunit ribosomal protein L10
LPLIHPKTAGRHVCARDRTLPDAPERPAQVGRFDATDVASPRAPCAGALLVSDAETASPDIRRGGSMPNAEKTAAVAEISEQFTSSAAAVITEYRGLSVKQLTELRRALGRDTTYAVVKNTLTKRAVVDAGVAIDEQLLVGPTAIAFINGDPVAAAKGLRDFARANPMLVIKGGIVEGKALSADEVNRIADLESREVLLAQVAGVLKALPTRAAGLFQAPLSQMARLAKALEDKQQPTETPEPAE